MFIAKYIAVDTAKTLKQLQMNYLDISGNCYIQTEDFLIYISGQKVQRKQKTNQAKAFQESGIKLLFQLLSNPDSLRLSYRELAKLSDISIGSVSNVIKELEEEPAGKSNVGNTYLAKIRRSALCFTKHVTSTFHRHHARFLMKSNTVLIYPFISFALQIMYIRLFFYLF